MPESVKDRCTKAHEYLFLLSKSPRYFYNADAIKEPCKYRSETKMPDGWDTGSGGHGSYHRSGREKGKKSGNIARKYDHLPGKDGVAHSVPWEGSNRNKRSVWTISTSPFKEAHFATFPPSLIKPCVLAGSKPGDTILDPFGGTGTTAGVALDSGRKAIIIEVSQKYSELIPDRISSITDAVRQGRLFYPE
jgi:DNA modification methylase